MYRVYILKSLRKPKYYIGCTSDLDRRLAEHNDNQDFFTKRFAPWQIVCYKNFSDQREAYHYEKVVKSYKGGNAFKKIVEDNDSDWIFPNETITGEVAERSKAARC